MLIDWFTVGAQTLNFLILVWLMKRFLYKPILHAIDERDKRIAAELADADAKRAEAQRERDEFQKKNAQFDRQRAGLLERAMDEVNAERHRLLDEARRAADALRGKRQDALQREQQALNDEITRRAQEEIFAIARQALTDLAGTSLEERMSEMFIHRLRELKGAAKETLAKGLEALSGPVIVRSAFDLPSQQRATIEQALHEIFSRKLQVRFETAPNLISGIELTTDGHKVAWSVSDYLASLETSVSELLQQQANSQGTRQATSQAESAVRANHRSQSGANLATPTEAT
jgi:F-type H+-transporting ATPase subunit b